MKLDSVFRTISEPILHGSLTKAIMAAKRRFGADPMRRTNTRLNVAARRDVMETLRAQGYSLPQIAKVFGMHHTSVIHSLRRMKKPEIGNTDELELLRDEVKRLRGALAKVHILSRIAC